ncbi:unnamed protein product [Thelazia callipaeda]|uniref:SURF1-like protein n=1 Tax=Thelazia callipaeda TaxID=103827 RepID=A0A0N5D3P6_THECL|nr:unnamed protein product [Thelazia callipaeda]
MFNGLTDKLLQHLVSNRGSKCLLFHCVRNSSVYDIAEESKQSSKKREKLWNKLNPIVGLGAPLLAFALGAWQLQRLRWKTDLLKKIENNSKQEVMPFPDENLSLLDDLEYAKVQLTGEFLHDREFYVLPRVRFDEHKDESKKRPSVSSLGNSGAQVITPFKLYPSGLIILVNRGWVPPQRINPINRAEGQVQGQVTFNAVVRHSEKKPIFVKKNDPDRNLWLYTDISQMAEKYGTEAVLVDACYGEFFFLRYGRKSGHSTVEGGPIGGQTRVIHRNDHMLYACFWFSIGAAVLYAWFL